MLKFDHLLFLFNNLCDLVRYFLRVLFYSKILNLWLSICNFRRNSSFSQQYKIEGYKLQLYLKRPFRNGSVYLSLQLLMWRSVAVAGLILEIDSESLVLCNVPFAYHWLSMSHTFCRSENLQICNEEAYKLFGFLKRNRLGSLRIWN